MIAVFDVALATDEFPVFMEIESSVSIITTILELLYKPMCIIVRK
jgi:hypothetical protein